MQLFIIKAYSFTFNAYCRFVVADYNQKEAINSVVLWLTHDYKVEGVRHIADAVLADHCNPFVQEI